MPLGTRDEVAERARSVFDDYCDTQLSTAEIAAKHGISADQVHKDYRWWWKHYPEYVPQPKRKVPRKKRRQCYHKLWDLSADELAAKLSQVGVRGVTEEMGCSRTTVWRAARANGLRRGKDGKYRVRPPSLSDPDEIDDYIKMLDARPRRGPSFVYLGDAQEIFGGRRTGEKALEVGCSHSFERLEIPDPWRVKEPRIIVRCRHCWGIGH